MSSNITGVEKLYETAKTLMWNQEGKGYVLNENAIYHLIDRAFQLGRLDGGAFVSSYVDTAVNCNAIDHQEQMDKDGVCNWCHKFVQATRFALSVLEK